LLESWTTPLPHEVFHEVQLFERNTQHLALIIHPQHTNPTNTVRKSGQLISL
jgi:hypothetical protein